MELACRLTRPADLGGPPECDVPGSLEGAPPALRPGAHPYPQAGARVSAGLGGSPARYIAGPAEVGAPGTGNCPGAALAAR